MTRFIVLLSALAAAVSSSVLQRRQASGGTNTPALPGPTYKVIPVVVGSPTREKSLLYYPNTVTAAPGDIIQFQFQLNNHSATQSAGPMAPCTPLQDSVPTAMHSGFVPGPQLTNSSFVGTFNMQVENTDTMYIYCATMPHCNLGQVMVINPKTPQDLANYRTAAMAQKMTVPAKKIMGGFQGRIPMNLAVPPAT